jgi:molybdopterin-containing oxidoreductase family iron-sulfur binding subunit
MNRLYALESTYSLTGTMADHRIALRADRVPLAAAHLAAELFLDLGLPLPVDGPAPALHASLEAFHSLPEKPSAVSTIAQDLLANRGSSVVAVGPRQPAEVHALAHWINAALGNVGHTVRYTEAGDPERAGHAEAIRELAGEMRSGAVGTLLILGGNPVFDAPADVDFAGSLRSVGTSLHLSLFDDETSQTCTWHLPRAHYLEAWGDVRSFDGTVSFAQPLIEPLYGGKSAIEILSMVAEPEPRSGHEIVRATALAAYVGLDFEGFWQRALHDGVVPGSAWPEIQPGLRPAEIRVTAPASEGLEVVFLQDSKVYDGRFANNAWLQELPDPLTKVTWDNAVLVGPATAAELGVKSDDLVVLRLESREVTLPVYVMPGQAQRSLAVSLGYGRTAAGKVGDGVGADTFRLRTSETMHAAYGATLQKTGRTHLLACTQNHHLIDRIGLKAVEKRLGELVREGDLATYRENPAFAREHGHSIPLVQLFQEHSYDEGYQWGMTIDLNSCTGCGTCVVACTAENNVPVVGRDEVIRGREMHWIRIDRYFAGDMDDPHVVHQPVACVHCENAPCEQVCPVAATTHSHEGLNQMVYNRCIGTRYCSNNCPYKVRRFNWFDNHKDLSRVEMMVYNPEVSLRSRGVMEKCTYCIQRVEAVKIAAKNEGRTIKDGEITTACAQACPAQAIVFGNLRDPDSRVRKLQENPRAYAMLEEINTRPRTQYLAKLRNPAGGASSPAEPAGGGGHHG